MKNYRNQFANLLKVVTVLMAISLSTACSDREETDIPLSEVPANIINIVQDTLPGIALNEAEKEIRGDKTIYELEGALINGLQYEIKIAGDGTILKIELDD
jgi:uncharacterized membrane protein YkoI